MLGWPRSKPANGTLPRWLVSHAGWVGEECLIWPFSRNPSGYACQVRLNGRLTYAHRHMCELANGPPPSPLSDTAHSCGRGKDGCVNPRHLRWASRADNMQDAIGHGTSGRSQLSHLSAQDVAEIRRLKGHASQRDIAKRFGISQGAVSNITTGKRWVRQSTSVE